MNLAQGLQCINVMNTEDPMSRNEKATCKELIEPALTAAGWEWDSQLRIGPGRVNMTGERMYDESQAIIADYLLRYRGAPLAILEAKAEGEEAADGMQQGVRYAQRLSLRFVLASNGNDWILTDRETGEFETRTTLVKPTELMARLSLHVDWKRWSGAFESPWYVDQISKKKVRPYQEMAISKTLWEFGQGHKRVLLLMATGTGKTMTVFQLIWKLFQGNSLERGHVLFLTDRNSLKDQAYRAFSAFTAAERVIIDKDCVAAQQHSVGKVFFANYQNLDEELDGKKIYQHFDAGFFDVVVVDECHRSGFGDWFGVLEHFGSAYQLGLTATPREIKDENSLLTVVEKRRDTFSYFGDPVFTYTLRQAIEDGYLVPYLLEERVTNLDKDGYTDETGKEYGTQNFEREIRMPDRTTAIAEDLWKTLNQYGLHNEKTIVFCVDDTHAAFMAAELRRLAKDEDYAARITRSERNSHMLERNFAEVGRSKPRVAVTVDLLTTGFDAPDVKNVVFVRPLQSAILYKQMKGRGTRLCEDIDKRYFTIFDYCGASHLEDAEFDGHPANKQKLAKTKKAKPKEGPSTPKLVGEGVSVEISETNRFVCLADGRKIPFEEYTEKTRDALRKIATPDMKELLQIWCNSKLRQELRDELRDDDIHISAFRHFFQLHQTDDVDILAKVEFNLAQVPARQDRVNRFWDQDSSWLVKQVSPALWVPEKAPTPEGMLIAADLAELKAPENINLAFWRTSLDHYSLYGVDDLEKGSTYTAPQFVNQFGSFSRFSDLYGGAKKLRADLEAIKSHLYIPMTA